MKTLRKSDLFNDPFKQFEQWFAEACQADIIHPHAMTLSTVSEKGRPSSRAVLLKSHGADGLVFFTNYQSRKAKELENNPYASLLFIWNTLSRQIRIEGLVEKVTKQESEEYFHTRPLESQIAAWASGQSEIIENRQFLEKRFAEFKKNFEGAEVPKPPAWGGYKLTPDSFEFWQSGENRLHDRFLYTKMEDGWRIERLAP